MKPIVPGHRVLIKPDTLHEYDPVFKQASQSGLILQPATERKEATGVDTGTVVDIGPSAWHGFGDGTPWCKIGDKVSYVRHGGKFVYEPTERKEHWLVINDEDVVMVWSE